MKRKFKLKNLFLISFAALAGILAFSAFSTMDNLYYDNEIKETKANGIYDGDYRVIYYYIDSNWEYDGGFGFNVNNRNHYYSYKIGDTSYTHNKFGSQGPSKGASCYSEVICDFAAKIYVPKTVTSIWFGSRDNDESNNCKTIESTLSDNDGKEAFIVTTSYWNNSNLQSGTWVSKTSFFRDYLKYTFFTSTNGWIGGPKGPSTIGQTWVFNTHNGSDGKSIGRYYQITDDNVVTLEGFSGTFAKALVSAKTSSKVRFQKVGEMNPYKNLRSQTTTLSDGENQIIYIYGNHTGTFDDTEQEVSVGTFLNKDDYLFFTPSSNWSGDNAGFRICTYGEDGAGQESYEAMTKLTINVFGGLFSSSDVYYYQLKKPCYQISFFRWNPTYMGDTASDKNPNLDNHKWNESGKCDTTAGKYWVNMGTSDWYDTWTTSESSGVAWSSYGDLRCITSDQSGANNNTTRVFLYNSGTHWESGGVCALRTFGIREPHQNLDIVSYVFNFFEDSTGDWYGYVDIPKTITGCQVVKMASETYGANNSYYQSNADFNLSSGSESCSNAVLYCAVDGNAISVGGSHDDEAGAVLLSKVLEACDTCSEDNLNGFISYPNLNNYYYSHAIAGAGSATCKSMNSNENYQIDIHFANIASRYANPSLVNRSMNNGVLLGLLNEGESNMSTIIIIIASSISLLSITALSILLVKKRSSNRKED